jgi:hypothetical protein
MRVNFKEISPLSQIEKKACKSLGTDTTARTDKHTGLTTYNFRSFQF